MPAVDPSPRLRPTRVLLRAFTCTLALLAVCPGVGYSDDADVGELLKARGAQVTQVKGVVMDVTVNDGSKFTDAEFRQLGRLTRLRRLSLNACLSDERLAQLTDLVNLEYLQTNLAQVTDDGLKPLARLEGLRTVKFFHPGKAFTGTGLVHMADLPHLESLTVAGSFAFNDEGMAAVGRLSGLREFRLWHAGPTDQGIKHLKGLKNLKSLNLGQRLIYKPPACPGDETLAVLAELASLETLQLSEARLTLAALRQLQRLPALKKLTLEGIDIPPADVELLKKDLPAVEVEWTRPNETYQKRIRALFGG